MTKSNRLAALTAAISSTLFVACGSEPTYPFLFGDTDIDSAGGVFVVADIADPGDAGDGGDTEEDPRVDASPDLDPDDADLDGDRDSPDLDTAPDTAPDHADVSVDTPPDLPRDNCPVARAACTVEGSGDGRFTELFVRPLDTLACSADGSSDPDGSILAYIWSVAEAPAGSTTTFVPADTAETSFFVDLAGRYVLHLEVVDDTGCVSEPLPVTLVARPDEDIHVQLVWSTPNDPDETNVGFGSGTDLDLHFRHQEGCWEDTNWDCHFRAREPNWGPLGPEDDPSLDIDDTDGAGPENVNLDNPESGIRYTVAAHYYNDHGFGASFATMRIFVFGELVFEARDHEMLATNAWWLVASIDWPSAEISAINTDYDSVPPCP